MLTRNILTPQVNPGAVGFYRVDYPATMLKEFLPAIQSKLMPALDRLGVIDDLYAVVKSGRKSTVEVGISNQPSM